MLDFLLLLLVPVIAIWYPIASEWGKPLLWLIWLRVIWRFYARTAKSNFPVVDCVISFVGLPLLAFLLTRSAVQVKVSKRVEWKGRTYKTGR